MTPPQPGDCIAQKYRLIARLARGGMGAVWKAEHLELETAVALKFLRHEAGLDERAEARFRREAQAAARLKSRHAVHIYDYGSHDAQAYIAMELLEGEDLEQHLGQGALAGARALLLLEQAARGLQCAHEAGLIHRDIKPSNLFLAREGAEVVLKLLDFGIAKSCDAESGETTAAGEVFGSPAYMSPEQARGGPVGAASDLWSMAAVFYRMLTGRSPFEGENASDIVVKVCTEDPVLPSALKASLGQDVDEFFRRALSRDQAQRFQTTAELVAAARELELGVSTEESGITRGEVGEPAARPSGVGRLTETAPLAVVTTPVTPAESHADVESVSLEGQKTLARVEASSQARGRKRRWLWGLVALGGASFGVWLFAARPPVGSEVGAGAEPPPGALDSQGVNQPGVDDSGVNEQADPAPRPAAAGLSFAESPSDFALDADSPRVPTIGEGGSVPPALSVAPKPMPAPVAAPASQERPAPVAQPSPAAEPLPRPKTAPTDPVFGIPVTSP